ncbi:MAG: T9SS type A sorting domain-containing protein, partial [Fibrobacter sp.]|nr:T9SS type A sorting domain-containing protein [Fibrobacter sp.]
MKFLFTFFFLLFSGHSLLYANEISLSGTVVNGESGAPIENASVYLHYKNHIKTRTDSQGKFLLSWTSSSGAYKLQNSPPAISIKNNFVNLQPASGSEARISVFTITGKQLYSTNITFTGTEQKRILLPTNKLSSGTYIISISCAKVQY